ncbi:MAG: hypothetical protein ACLGIA_11610 [Actinomycetes bacterium]
MTRAGAAGVVLVGLVILVLAASNVGGRASRSDEHVSVELLQYRRDQADRRVEVKVGNGGEADLVVTRLELRVPGFQGSGPVAEPAVVPPGQRVDLRVPYGEPQCHLREQPREGPVVRLWLGQDRRATELTARAGSGVLRSIFDRECAARRIASVAPLAWSPEWQSTAPGAVEGALLVGPVAAGHTASVLDVEGTTLFAVTATGLPISLAVAQTAAVPVRLTPQRCDPHAVAESKRGYAFDVRIVVNGPDGTGPEGVVVTVPLTGPGQDVAEKALLQGCGLA